MPSFKIDPKGSPIKPNGLRGFKIDGGEEL